MKLKFEGEAESEERARHEDMTKRLNDDKYWIRGDNDYTFICPICGALIIVGMKLVHVSWHEINNA